MTIVPKAPALVEVGRLVHFRHHGSNQILLGARSAPSLLQASFVLLRIDFVRWGPVFAPPTCGITDPVLP